MPPSVLRGIVDVSSLKLTPGRNSVGGLFLLARHILL